MQLENESPDFLVYCYQQAREAADRQCRCRECDVRCWPLSTICQVCGTQDPVRLPMVWLYYAAGAITLGTVMAIWLF